ncbi:efflux RND transporter permease subunit [Phaeovulum vinaykumarii]|uniref:Multidrug efflux pump subunit AcrB n=1 Tax=Phaeovulum vinaykumarii TaxID=407234 RepID=A0A1N7JWE0_9RHOB|nr:efflux RND transporter permease subunit [Phaeovulum vinaykumarii]SIS53591.1 Multidrug efflux pump subunit AcrB [Phaeovulum vinaykumarii]SOB91646.1 multidrug efflux pump subunit AcrB [Phaeovulum vinaykumarii]
MTARFNLSEWALRHRSMVWFMIIVSLVAGVLSYFSLGREEDPSFTIKIMTISAALPGATAEETREQVTDRIEKKLQELPNLKFTRSETFPGRTLVYLELRPETRGRAVADTWQKVRNMMGDIRGDFPAEFAGFSFNDSFGDVYGTIYAFTADGFSPQELKDHVEAARSAVLTLKDAGKVELIGTRDPVVHVEFSARKLAAMGLDQGAVLDTLAAQNAILPSGVIRTRTEMIAVRLSGRFASAAELASAPLRVGDRFFTLSDVAEVRDGYDDPPGALFRYNGQDAIALIIGMRQGANILKFGEDLSALMARVEAGLPLGIEIHKVADQPKVVETSVDHFLKALVEAIAIVLAVSFVSLGWRAGLVVSMSIPLVLALTFVILDMMGVTLQRISLGALIIALGLLVDDAMIAIETMVARLEAGDDLGKAASYAWTSIAFPMLTGTLATVAGFIPIGFNASQAGEYTQSLFYVLSISLLLSWIVAVLFAPLLGATFLPARLPHHDPRPGRLRRVFHRALKGAMRARWLTIGLTLVMFATALWGMRFVERQFFPASDRPELLIDVNLRQNSALAATDAAIADLERWLLARPEVDFLTGYVGRSAPRFLLSLDAPTPAPFMGQIVVMTHDLEARNRLRAALDAHGGQTPGVDLFVRTLELGPPVGKPVQYRLSGPDRAVLLDEARALAARLADDARLADITLDEGEPVRVARVILDQAQLRQLGLTQRDVALALRTLYDGTTITELRRGRDLIDVIARGQSQDRSSIAALQSLQIPGPAGVAVPLLSFARIEWTLEPPVLHQRDRVPTITVRASVKGADQPATITAELAPEIARIAETLPAGYAITAGGVAESSAESQAPIIAVVPVMLLVLLSIVMIQMQSFRLMFIVLAVAPLGLIGVVAALAPTGAPLGFVAILGVLALAGILIRNSIILIHEVETLVRAGKTRWEAVFEASDSRARPILLTAAAASLALIPISREVFWTPMAFAMMGGIVVGTLITLLFAPALYCAVFRVRPPAPDAGG